MTWDEAMKQLAERGREPEMLDGVNVTGQVDIPYFQLTDVEQHLFIASNEVLREIPPDDLEAIGSPAITVVSGVGTATNGIRSIAIPIGAVKLLGVSVDGAPAVFASPANFFQRLPGSTKFSNCYTYFGGRCAFVGGTIKLVFLSEPTLDVWKSTPNILPEGWDLVRIDRAYQRMQIADYMPPPG